VQAVSGLVLAGTDVYMPPFGNVMKEWVAEDKSRLEDIKPYSKTNVNEEQFKEMRDFRKPFITAHYYSFYVLLGAIVLHIIGVTVTELREKNGVVSAMFTGEKVSSKKPVDSDET
jgi:cytochrome b